MKDGVDRVYDGCPEADPRARAHHGWNTTNDGGGPLQAAYTECTGASRSVPEFPLVFVSSQSTETSKQAIHNLVGCLTPQPLFHKPTPLNGENERKVDNAILPDSP